MIFLDHYYYGSDKLPELPKYDKELYPYSYISQDADCFYFTAASKEGYFEGSIGYYYIYTLGGTLTSDDSLKFNTFTYGLAKEGVDLEQELTFWPGINTKNWILIDSETNVPAVAANLGPTWVSTNLKYEDGTIVEYQIPRKVFSTEKFLVGMQLALAGMQIEDVDLQRKYIGYFPEIPEYDGEKYPYILATVSAINGVLLLYASTTPFCLDEDRILCFEADGEHIYSSVIGKGVSTWLPETIQGWGEPIAHNAMSALSVRNFKLLWSNEAVRYGEGVLDFLSFPTTPPSVY